MGAGVGHEVVIEVPLEDEALARAVLSALRPEAERPPTKRFQVRLSAEGANITISIRAGDLSSLRAALNAYMSWLRAVVEACSAGRGEGGRTTPPGRRG